ncbi:MAG: VOC family protein [Acidobacteriota bacterium]
MNKIERITARTCPVDHLLFGTDQLDRGIAWIEDKTGVRPAVGGSHPGIGTCNALLSLGGRQYLEIIAPDPDQESYQFHIDLRIRSVPRLVTWAALATDIDWLADQAQKTGFQTLGPRAGSRRRPDGAILKWRTLGVVNSFGSEEVEPVPFFIEWSPDSPHPSQDSPFGCRLESLEIHHPRALEVAKLFAALDLGAQVATASEARIVATLHTPQGRLQLG